MKTLNNRSVIRAALAIISFVFVLSSADAASGKGAPKNAPQSAQATVTPYATGLNNPRGLAFGPDGFLYVAEGGIGGTDPACVVVAAVGPYTGSPTNARVSRIVNGVPVPVGDPLPSNQTSMESGSLVSGVADVAFIGDTLYALISGAGCSHGVANIPNEVVRLNDDGSWTQIANLSAFQMANPVKNPEMDDFEPDGTWWNMIAVRGDLYAVEPNHGELDKITTSGQISRIADISATQGHIVPTALAYHGNFYVGNLNTFPVVPGSSKILKINPAGNVKVDVGGLTTVLGLVFDGGNRMYVLETSTAPGDPAAFTGKVIRVDPSGKQTEIVSGLFFPTGMTLGPDGALYVSNVGFGPPPIGLGQILRIEVP
jgi:hypothetical protein